VRNLRVAINIDFKRRQVIRHAAQFANGRSHVGPIRANTAAALPEINLDEFRAGEARKHASAIDL